MAKRGLKLVAKSQFSVEEIAEPQARSNEAVDTPPEQIDAAETDTQPKPKKLPAHKLAGLIGLTSLIGIVVLWALCSALFSKYKIGSASVSRFAGEKRLAQVINSQTQTYKLTINYPDKTKKSFGLQDVGLQVDTKAMVASLHHYRLADFLAWWHPKPARILFTTDIKTFNAFVAKSLTITIQPAEDAHLAITDGNIVLSNSSAGKRYGLPNPKANIEAAASGLQNAPISLELLALHPSITTEQLANSKAKLEKVLSQQIEFTIAGKIISPSATDIGNWLELTPNDKSRSVDITVNSGKVLDYINKMATRYIHPPRDEVVVVHNDGTTVTLVRGLGGVDIVTKPAIAANIADNLLAAKGMQVDLPIKNAPYKTITAGEYDKWIEVDLTNKRMYAYEQSNLVGTFLVSAGAPATPTVTGQFNIYSKIAQQDMRGRNVDGSGYFQPNVPWINYFYKDYAIHGNYWRPFSYFGNINSSHGCVGMIVDDAQWLYEWAPLGTTVIVHT